ncbi:hypothetical protein GCK72_022967 [Caenorhabditis remanei]|uniref:Uncharacterized protein n=1 Tax=Caenorhabditis remanei TaxID=31234 RepID=E3N8F3_CAERE|nr:hypothetical protein GCK72_022967 [Caenorhabditis remanei]EFO89467.1 hypothetical protein CRE_19965 [Caenorhabditis remanei]KAF1746511.1 hypothetical protein GCK72_022967 [Caenorhabditis remanei]
MARNKQRNNQWNKKNSKSTPTEKKKKPQPAEKKSAYDVYIAAFLIMLIAFLYWVMEATKSDLMQKIEAEGTSEEEKAELVKELEKIVKYEEWTVFDSFGN